MRYLTISFFRAIDNFNGFTDTIKNAFSESKTPDMCNLQDLEYLQICVALNQFLTTYEKNGQTLKTLVVLNFYPDLRDSVNFQLHPFSS